jgi:hypothetical protein
MKRAGDNRDFLKSLITSKGASFVDLTFSLPAGVFAWKSHSLYINEHLNSKGRLFVAKKIDMEIRKVLKLHGGATGIKN